MSNTQLAERPQKHDLRVMIQSETIQQQLAMALPRYYSPDQFTVIVRTAINRNPKLGECDPGSFMTSMITAAQMGIAPDGRNGYLIPRWNGKTNRLECTFMPSYIGLIGLVRKNPEVADIYAETVHAEDELRITKGLHRDIVHEVDVKKARGPIIGAYAVISYKDGRASWEFMSREEIEGVRARSDSWRAHVAKGYDTPWKTDEGEMFKKTALKRLIKTADISQETADRIAVDNTLDVSPQAPEIKPAVIPAPERPALPEPSGDQNDPQPELEQEPEPQPEPEKKAKAKAKKLAAAPEPEPEAQGEQPASNPLADQCEEKLKEAGYTPADLIRCAQANDWLPKTHDPEKTPLSVLGDEDLGNFIDPENWPTVLSEIKRIAKK